jgi:hypothetical protein
VGRAGAADTQYSSLGSAKAVSAEGTIDVRDTDRTGPSGCSKLALPGDSLPGSLPSEYGTRDYPALNTGGSEGGQHPSPDHGSERLNEWADDRHDVSRDRDEIFESRRISNPFHVLQLLAGASDVARDSCNGSCSEQSHLGNRGAGRPDGVKVYFGWFEADGLTVAIHCVLVVFACRSYASASARRLCATAFNPIAFVGI